MPKVKPSLYRGAVRIALGPLISYSWRMRLLVIWAVLLSQAAAGQGILVLQTDFGLKDHAVAAMRGVARRVDPKLVIDDLTHEIPAFDVWQAAYRLHAVVEYWPANTVFVSVVDPGVGSKRESVAAQLVGGQLVVTPNNGTLTLLQDSPGITGVRRIDEDKYRLPGSADSHTFHGRDLYVHVGALLASERLRFEDLSEARAMGAVVRLEYENPTLEPGRAAGGIPVLDPQFGNVWTNLPASRAQLAIGDRYAVEIVAPNGETRFAMPVPFVRTFAEVATQTPLLYVNSIGNLALALNQGNFVRRFGVSSGPGWQVVIEALEDESSGPSSEPQRLPNR